MSATNSDGEDWFSSLLNNHKANNYYCAHSLILRLLSPVNLAFPGILLTMLFMERLGRKRTLAGELLLIAANFCLMFICTDR